MPSKYISTTIVLMLAALMFFPVINAAVRMRLSDFHAFYTPFVQHIGEWGMVTVPNFLYPLLVFTISWFTGSIDFDTLHVLTTTSFFVLLALVLLFIFRQEAPQVNDHSLLLRVLFEVFFVLSMILLAPVSILTFGNEHHYFGYIGMAIYHNPNIALARPLCLLHFFLLARFLQDPRKMMPVTLYLAMPLLLAVSAIAKPNYLLALMPTIVLYCIYQVLRKQSVPWKELVFAVFLPLICILGWQYAFTYLYPNPDLHPAEIVWAPFVAYRIWADDLFIKFLLSIFFPAGVLFLYWDELRSDKTYLLALALVSFGLMINYGFSESGTRAMDMNFAWTGQITLFIFTVFSALRVIRIEKLQLGYTTSSTDGAQKNVRLSNRLITVSLLFGLHLVSGIIWYYRELSTPRMFW